MFSEDNLHKYGTPLPPLEMDQVPSKKPLYVQDQVATDDQGRRRFHGAFTGGFSAGYWNTVGSKEGWTPQSFKSSRTEKATQKLGQKPEDFMDDEDRGEFGIAPKGLKINEDFSSSTDPTEVRKRKFLKNDLQPIPGEPVLHQLIKPVKDKAAVRILKTWGWRPGQGIGPRQTRSEKKKARQRNKKELYLIEKYGCELPSTSNRTLLDSDNEDDDETEDEEEEVTFAPEDCELPPYYNKTDKYGIGYKPLSRQSVLGGSLPSKQNEHINLFQPLEAIGKNNQKISFSGHAFGVGALEEDDDDDVYAMDDSTRYDFTLEDKRSKATKKKDIDVDDLLFGEFVLDRNPPKLPIYKVEIPFGWHPRNFNEKRSRFEPIDPRKQRQLDEMFSTSSSKAEMTREKRAELLGDEIKGTQASNTIKQTIKEVKSKTVKELQLEYKERKEKTKHLMEKITAKSSSFTKGGVIDLDGEEKHLSQDNITSTFRPFAMDEKKQKRYDLFLAKEFKNEQEIEDFLKTIQPVELSQWDRQMELREFQQAKKLYKPLKGIMSDRFITETEIKAVESVTKNIESKSIVVERTKQMWKPQSLLCKRYNIAEPFKGSMEENKKSTLKQKKLSVFDYLETSINKKEDFQTPVIIPRNIEKPKEIVGQTTRTNKAEVDKEKEIEVAPLEWQEVLNPSVKANKEFVFKPKTELEKEVVLSINKPVAEKKELFKAIFSDSESGEDEEDVSANKSKVETTPSISKPLNAAAANILRNNSPPRGIFKALFATSLTKSTGEGAIEKETKRSETSNEDSTLPSAVTNKVVFKPKSERELKSSMDEVQATVSYGPALPQSLVLTHSNLEKNTSKPSIDEKLLNLFNKHKPNLEVTEKWIEKTSNKDSSDTEESSLSTDAESSSNLDIAVHKKKAKKSKKNKISEHKHKKHKESKYSKKPKKHNKKKKHKK